MVTGYPGVPHRHLGTFRQHLRCCLWWLRGRFHGIPNAQAQVGQRWLVVPKIGDLHSMGCLGEPQSKLAQQNSDFKQRWAKQCGHHWLGVPLFELPRELDPWISLALQTWTHPLWSIDRLYEDLDLTADLCGGPQLASTV